MKLLAETQPRPSPEPTPERTDARSTAAGTLDSSRSEPPLLPLRSKPCPFWSEETA